MNLQSDGTVLVRIKTLVVIPLFNLDVTKQLWFRPHQQHPFFVNITKIIFLSLKCSPVTALSPSST